MVSAQARRALLARFRWVSGHADVWRVFRDADALRRVVSAVGRLVTRTGATLIGGSVLVDQAGPDARAGLPPVRGVVSVADLPVDDVPRQEHAGAAALLDRIRRDIAAALGTDLLGLYVHGSWVAGDFEPRRSDLDLLAVLGTDPTEEPAATLAGLHAALVRDEPAWADRVEVEYLSAAALTSFRTDPRPMVRISPGEPLHRTPATAHYLLDWSAARERSAVLHGPPAEDLVPAISTAEVAASVRAHLEQWPDWVAGMRTPGGQAYAVLTLCRALCSIRTGGQVSKRAAASWAIAELPSGVELIGWAQRWWYGGGTDAEPDRLPEVEDFVRSVAQLV